MTKPKQLKVSKEFVAGKHGIGYIYKNFKYNFYDMEFELTEPKLKYQVLEKYMTNQEILDELKPSESSLGDLLYAIEHSKEVGLSTDGYANLFFVRNKMGILWLVHAILRSDDWYFSADPLDNPLRWVGGCRVFSRKFGVLGNSDSGNLDGKIMEMDGVRYKLRKI